MSFRFALVLVACGLISPVAAAQAPVDGPPSLNSPKASQRVMGELQPQVVRAIERGVLLYNYDQAAWHGTDDFITKASDAIKAQAAGYVMTGPAQSVDLVFYDESTPPKALYRARFANGKQIEGGLVSVPSQPALSAEELAMIKARGKAVEAFRNAKVSMCAKTRPNITIIPPETPNGPRLAYLMTPQTQPGSYPFGGHYSVEISATGAAGKVRHFTNSCLEMADDKEAVALGVTHLLDPTPTEIHVFTSLAAKKPVYVATSNGMTWRVEGSAISLLAEKAAKN